MLNTMIDAHIRCVENLKEMAPALDAAGSAMLESLVRGGKLLVCGNGGSAADAQHFAAEEKERADHEQHRQRREAAAEQARQ